ncbi:MAG: histidine--tRNA ligase [Candidatus Dadabacteria bacterium]|nr:histidine--tRNA ligase [Candidatus Dadabacteria bacterium]NIS09179.1 histidine--tRNA ligase [Candidatus Dadabacteria bacterium]NIY22486.1 histidine--tRNA ligase [Candidatus Dadabacteria bacterium]
MKTQTIRGFKDTLPETIKRWHFIEDTAKQILELYGFSEIRPPLLEFTDVFSRSIGTTTDIVEKEMYTFLDRDGSSLTLRPEGTASVVRSYIENSMHLKSPINKLYYLGPMFRHERPQKGRYRSFSQIGAELFGSFDPQYDAEVITMLWQLFEKTGISADLQIELSSLGDDKCRPHYKEEITKALKAREAELCDDCKRRLSTNPLRILDCKKESCSKATVNLPSILDFLCPECDKHFGRVRELLDMMEIKYVINPKIVRGLDYYNRTVFEITTSALGSQNAVAAGGRYDGLVKQLGGQDTPAIGFAVGIERMILLHEKQYPQGYNKKTAVYIAYLDNKFEDFAMKTAYELRQKGLMVEVDYNDRSLKSKLKRANKLEAKHTIIVGEEEFDRGKVKIRNMQSSSEEEVDIDKINRFDFL